MQFTWPWTWPLFGLIPLLIVLYVWIQRRRSRYAMRFSTLVLIKAASGRRSGLKRHVPSFFLLLSLTAMLIALARPFATVTLAQTEATVILAIDVSRSMRAADLKPSRIEAAKTAARTFIEHQGPTTRMGLVAFSGIAALVQVPTRDHQVLLSAIDRLDLERSTAIGSGILTSLDAILEQDNPAAYAASHAAGPSGGPTPIPPQVRTPAVIVLLTDGQNTTGPSPLQAASEAANRGVRIFTIGVGTAAGATIGPGQGGGGYAYRAELDETTLRRVAQFTGGAYFHASDENALADIYKDLETRLVFRTEPTELTFGFTSAAAFFALVSGLLSLLWFSRLP